MALGRPSKFTPEIAEKIYTLISTTSMSLRAIALMDDMPSLSTICKWLKEDVNFSQQYARAKEMQADILASEIIEIADDASKDIISGENGDYGNSAAVNRSRLQVDARKWAASKLAPKKYGDKVDITTDGKALPTTINIIHDTNVGS
jgi:hypothetical protein